jgi:hypothetical protein
MVEAEIRPFTIDDTESVVALWRAAGLVVPWNDPHQDIQRKLTVQPELFLIAAAGGVIEWYRTLGYEPDDAVSLGKRLIPDVRAP